MAELSAEELNKKGMELAEEGKLDEAIKYFDAALKKDLVYSWAWYNKGEALRRQEKFKMAKFCYAQTIGLNQNDAGALNGKGMCMMELGEFREALELFEKAATISPNWTWPWYNIGEVYRRQEKYEEAIKFYDKVLGINKEDAWAWYQKGICLWNLKKTDSARTAFRNALDINPNFAEVCFAVGKMAYVDGESNDIVLKFLKEALELFRKQKNNKGAEEVIAFMDKIKGGKVKRPKK